MFRRTVRALLLPAALSLAPALPLAAQATSPWEAWIGCWDLVPRDGYTASAGRVCVTPTANPAIVDLLSVVGDSVTGRQRLDATADKREVKQPDCSGMESVKATGTRVYLRTTLRCGSENRLVNSVMAMSSGGEWIDVRGVAFGTNVGVRPARYRETLASVKLPAEVSAALANRPRGVSSARIAASGMIEVDDVVEASKYLEIGVLQTWLAERRQSFLLNADRLLALQDAGVAPSVIDVMVALSYPEQFALDRTRLGDPPPDVRGEVRGGEIYGGGWYDDGYGYDPYGYGYGRGNGWYSGRQPVVVVQRPSNSDDDDHGKVVKGRGYVSGRDDSRSGGDRSGGSSAGSSGGSGGGSDKGSSTGRKAKPKGSSD